MAQCSHCGSMASEGAQFCPGCGSSIRGFAQTTVATSQAGMGYGVASYDPTPAYRPALRAPFVVSIILAVLLVGVSVTLIVVLAAGGGNKSAVKPGMGPGETVRTVYKTTINLFEKLKSDAFTKSDLETAYDTFLDAVTVDRLRTGVNQHLSRRGFVIPSIEILDEQIYGDRATVTFGLNYGNGRVERGETVQMIKEGGKWKLDAGTWEF